MRQIPRMDALFKTYFGINDIFQDKLSSIILEKYSLDICKFDDWCINHHGYRIETDGSLLDFITKKFGKEAANFITTLIYH